MKKIELTDHEKMIVELCVRSVLCDLLNKEHEAIHSFTAGLFNINNEGTQKHFINDTNDWIAQLPILREVLRKLQSKEELDLPK